MKQPIAPIPSPFKALVAWLRLRRGLDLTGRINFLRGFAIDGIVFTKDDAIKIKELIDATGAKNPRNKHPAKSEESQQEF